MDPNKIYQITANDGRTGEVREISYSNMKAVGNGSFGVVFQAKIMETGDMVAIKKVLQDKRFKVCDLPLRVHFVCLLGWSAHHHHPP